MAKAHVHTPEAAALEFAVMLTISHDETRAGRFVEASTNYSAQVRGWVAEGKTAAEIARLMNTRSFPRPDHVGRPETGTWDAPAAAEVMASV
jgi:hypothetical protein